MRICTTRRSLIREVWRRIQKNPTFLKSIGSNYKLYGDEPQLGVDEFIKAYWQLDLRSLEETTNFWSKVHISCSLPKICVAYSFTKDVGLLCILLLTLRIKLRLVVQILILFSRSLQLMQIISHSVYNFALQYSRD